MLLITLCFLSIILSIFIARKSVELNDDLFDGEIIVLIVFILSIFIPFINVIIHTGILLVKLNDIHDWDSNVDDIAKKLFNIKSKQKGDK